MQKAGLICAVGIGWALAGALLSGAEIPRPAPNMTFKKPDGGVIDLRQYRGKLVALEFLLTTCPHCQKCSGIFQKMQVEYGPKGFQAVGVAVNDPALVQRYVMDLKLRFPVGFATVDQAKEYLQHPAMDLIQFPQMVFIDRRGAVRYQHMGCREDEEKDIRAKIEELLNARPAGAAAGVRVPAPKGAAK